MTMMISMIDMMMMMSMMVMMSTMMMMLMLLVTRSVAVDVVGLFLLIRFLSNRSFLLFSSYDDDHETTLMVIMMVMTNILTNIRIMIIMTLTSLPLLWHQVSFSVELPPLSFVRRTS